MWQKNFGSLWNRLSALCSVYRSTSYLQHYTHFVKILALEYPLHGTTGNISMISKCSISLTYNTTNAIILELVLAWTLKLCTLTIAADFYPFLQFESVGALSIQPVMPFHYQHFIDDWFWALRTIAHSIDDEIRHV